MGKTPVKDRQHKKARKSEPSSPAVASEQSPPNPCHAIEAFSKRCQTVLKQFKKGKTTSVDTLDNTPLLNAYSPPHCPCLSSSSPSSSTSSSSASASASASSSSPVVCSSCAGSSCCVTSLNTAEESLISILTIANALPADYKPLPSSTAPMLRVLPIARLAMAVQSAMIKRAKEQREQAITDQFKSAYLQEFAACFGNELDAIRQEESFTDAKVPVLADCINADSQCLSREDRRVFVDMMAARQ